MIKVLVNGRKRFFQITITFIHLNKEGFVIKLTSLDLKNVKGVIVSRCNGMVLL